MKILETPEDFVDAVNKMIDEKPDFIYISTFGMYLGISIDDQGNPVDWHEKYPKPLRSCIERIIENNIPCKIITGETVKDLCCDDCPHCIKINERFMDRLEAHVEKFDSIDFRIKTEYHMKMMLSNKSYILGGRNFSESNYKDLSFIGNDKKMIKDLKEIFERNFNE